MPSSSSMQASMSPWSAPGALAAARPAETLGRKIGNEVEGERLEHGQNSAHLHAVHR